MGDFDFSILHTYPWYLQKVALKTPLTRDRVSQIELEFGSVGFWEEGKIGTTREKLIGARDRTNNKLNPHMAKWLSTPGFELGSH